MKLLPTAAPLWKDFGNKNYHKLMILTRINIVYVSTYSKRKKT